MKSGKIAIGDIVHCNRCDKPFEAIKEMFRDMFCGQEAARIHEFSTCPMCQQTDNHWVYATDITPKFEGGFEKRRRVRRHWLQEN